MLSSSTTSLQGKNSRSGVSSTKGKTKKKHSVPKSQPERQSSTLLSSSSMLISKSTYIAPTSTGKNKHPSLPTQSSDVIESSVVVSSPTIKIKESEKETISSFSANEVACPFEHNSCSYQIANTFAPSTSSIEDFSTSVVPVQSSFLSSPEKPVLLSSSPVKNNPDVWISTLDLYTQDKKILETKLMLG